jgi:predicted membrane channel-forming protein YqfA (hemolysin III family)
VEGFPALLVCLTSMDLVTFLIWFVVFVGIAAIVWWAINKVSLPEPAKIIFYVAVAIMAIVLLLKLPSVVAGL